MDRTLGSHGELTCLSCCASVPRNQRTNIKLRGVKDRSKRNVLSLVSETKAEPEFDFTSVSAQ